MRADQLIHTDRNNDYGAPIDDFYTIAEFWTTWAQARSLLKPTAVFVPEDVPIMLTLMKISRESRKHKLDNITDAAGYFGTLGMVIAARFWRHLGAAYSKLVKRPWEEGA